MRAKRSRGRTSVHPVLVACHSGARLVYSSVLESRETASESSSGLFIGDRNDFSSNADLLDPQLSLSLTSANESTLVLKARTMKGQRRRPVIVAFFWVVHRVTGQEDGRDSGDEKRRKVLHASVVGRQIFIHWLPWIRIQFDSTRALTLLGAQVTCQQQHRRLLGA